MKFHKGTREEFLEDMQTEFAYASLRTELTKYQERFVRRYCSQFTTPTVVCYCHYCLEGLLQGGVDGRHLADLVFRKKGRRLSFSTKAMCLLNLTSAKICADWV